MGGSGGGGRPPPPPPPVPPAESGIVCTEVGRAEVRLVQESPQRIVETDVYEFCRMDRIRNRWLRVARVWIVAPTGRAAVQSLLTLWDSAWGVECKPLP